jgi:glycosyltransferase involved in cell wall biosynthesis
MGLNILLASDHYPPFIGGAHRQTQLLARELSQRGHTISVATSWQKGLPDIDSSDGFPVYRVRQLRNVLPQLVSSNHQQHQPPFPDPVSMAALRRIILQVQPDIVHAYGWISFSCAIALADQNIPMALAVRDYAYTCPRRTLLQDGHVMCSGPGFSKCMRCSVKLYGKVKGWAATLGVLLTQAALRNKVRGMHYISSYTQEVMQRDFGSATAGDTRFRQPIIEATIPSFMDTSELEDHLDQKPELQAYLRLLPEEPFILFVGALRRVKGIYQLLDAYQKLSAPPPLVLIGTIENDTPKEFPSGVHVLQNFPHQAVLAAWERSLFGVFPSLWAEPLGSVVYEAMSRGRTAIGTTPGGHTDMIIPGKTGLLVAAGDVAGLADAMTKLVQDPELRRAYERASLDHSQHFTADVTIPKFEQFYRDVIQAGA